jgi:hypothetical protein
MQTLIIRFGLNVLPTGGAVEFKVAHESRLCKEKLGPPQVAKSVISHDCGRASTSEL